ncbi:MAG: imidazole glycerol phosphate synthase subunit HisH [Edaphocola sp.]
MIAIIQYNAGNTTSVANALHRLNCPFEITDDAAKIRAADKVILPGVGEAAWAMQHLRAKGLDVLIPQLTQPLLGICLGLQLLCRHSEEGDVDCLGIFDTPVKKFVSQLERVPHIGWNNFTEVKGSLFNELSANNDVYFVHSYYAALCKHTVAVCDYIQPFSAALARDNFYAVQFHPEKSAEAGNQIIKNFLAS